MSLSSNFSVSKANVFIEPQQSAIPTIFIFYLVVKRLMIKNSVVKIQTLVVNDKSRPIKLNHVNIFFVFFFGMSFLAKSAVYFYIIRFMTMFLKVLNQVNFRCLHKPKLFMIDLLPFAKLLELLALNHSSLERRIVFVPRLLKFSHVRVVL